MDIASKKIMVSGSAQVQEYLGPVGSFYLGCAVPNKE
jgi:hypothetical protein